MAKNKQLEALLKLGQSVWYDNLSRDVLRSGELGKIIESGVTGLTSNPSIFKKAIADSSDYDADMQTIQAKGKSSTEDICEELMIRDVAAAADLLRPIYDQSKGADGLASIEVSPLLAAEAEATLSSARSIWKKLNRPNIMIKVPATKECIPVIETLLTEGINVNITLIFSVAVYEQVAQAYLNALDSRMKKNQPIDRIASVASFFVSRVDAIVEKHFDLQLKAGKVKDSDRAAIDGKVGIANSKLAYKSFKKLFSGSRWDALIAKGAHVQRPLWASTGTKNPKFSPVLYCEELAGKDTVNTVPPATLKALTADAKIEPRLERGLSEAEETLKTVARFGIEMNSLLAELQVDGVNLFADAYKDLLASIEVKKAKVAA